MSKISYELSIICGRFSGHIYNAFYATKKDAEKAKKKLLGEVLKYKEDRPNNEKSRTLTVKHDLGELTVKADEVGEVSLFDREEADKADQQKNDERHARQVAQIANIVKEVLKQEAA